MNLVNETSSKYITLSNRIYGTFSNSATENSDLEVSMLIDNPSTISIFLYEYAGKNPVKAGLSYNYFIKVKPDDGESVILFARNNSDRLVLNKADSKKLCHILSNGGKIQFFIIDVTEYSHSSYRFDINDSEGFDKALSEL